MSLLHSTIKEAINAINYTIQDLTECQLITSLKEKE